MHIHVLLCLGDEWRNKYLGDEWRNKYLGDEWGNKYLGDEWISLTNMQYSLGLGKT